MKVCHILIMLSLSITVSAQSPDLPVRVKDEFKKTFPYANDINWALNNDKYEIEFYIGPDLYTAIYDDSGNMLETAIIISDDQIPEKLLAAIANKHPDAGLAYAEKVTTSKNEKFIRVVAESENMVYTVIAKLDGTIIKIETQNYNSNQDEGNGDVE
jgi:hypothetical protein